MQHVEPSLRTQRYNASPRMESSCVAISVSMRIARVMKVPT